MNGDIENVYAEYADNVYRYLLSLTRSAELAEDLTQETFYRAMKSMSRYDGSCKMSVWLCQIAKHIWYQELEKRNKHKTSELTDDIAADGTPEDAAALGGDKAALYKAIHSLGEPMREVVYMRLTGEFSFAEIGEILDKTENWARTTFYRAKQKIMEVM
ncbi:MAG: sigma-70 family RNA polymerase sigma factor [Oscillospiraceae bacterium]|nr:sigma-70 family RNA polymerase sigma factor [Oscillospiraceae bacterium]